MRWATLTIVALLFGLPSFPKSKKTVTPQPDQFEIGRRTFWDFGPPSNFYDVFVVRPSVEGATVERIILTPAVDECFAPAKVELASVRMKDSPVALLGSMNPCAIPEKELKRKDNCKHCQRFSGADIVMRVRCGQRVRLIPSHVFEDYWFNSAAKPPKTTFSMLQLVKRLDDAVGPGVMDERVFDLGNGEEPLAKPVDSLVIQSLGAGEYDDLFKEARDKPSELYRSAQDSPNNASIRLLTSVPFMPEVSNAPVSPLGENAVSIDGRVNFTAQIDSAGAPTNVSLEGNSLILRSPIWRTILSWRYPRDAFNLQIHGTMGFHINCHPRQP